MALSASVVIPVKDGARYLGELLDAVLRQEHGSATLEVLVVDSGSHDDSVAIARAAGAEVLEIAPGKFGHGRTRNLAAERTAGELICFLTQDATPVPGWLAAYQQVLRADATVGAAYGPHLARANSSPMIARELEEFFAQHGPRDRPTIQGPGDRAFLSNVNACYRRSCWKEVRFDDVAYAEDQAFGAAMLARTEWRKAFVPAAAVLHAHDYPPLEFMRRYFDEYRGLRATTGHVEPLRPHAALGTVRALVRADRSWMRDRDYKDAERRRWTRRATVHHGGRVVFSALGSRAHLLPTAVQRRLSLEGTAPGREASPMPPTVPVAAAAAGFAWEAIGRVAREGPAPLETTPPRDEGPLHVAVAIPPFSRGSGGHTSIFQMLSRLERGGHTVSVWVEDPAGVARDVRPAAMRRQIREWFAPLEGPVFKGFNDWYGADIAVATGWQTVHRTLLLPGCRGRAYLVHDHENEFFPTSAERRWAEETYGFGLHAICGSPWLAQVVSERYGGSTSVFDFGVDHEVYRRLPVERRRDTVLFYSRDVTPRRAVPLGLLALEELARRRPDVRIIFFGSGRPAKTPFAYEDLGVASPTQLARAYAAATVGMVLSMTNYSLVPQEMLACGLPCVDLAGFSAETVFGDDGPVELTAFHPAAIADALERLLDDQALWDVRSQAGIAFVANRTWDRATEQLEAGLRIALRAQP